MKQKPIDLTPTDHFNIALGQEIVAYLCLEFNQPLPKRSYCELGAAYCTLFNDRDRAPSFSKRLVNDFNNCLATFSTDHNEFMDVIKKVLSEEDPSIEQRPNEDFIIDPELSSKTTELLCKIKNDGLKSVITPQMLTPTNMSLVIN